MSFSRSSHSQNKVEDLRRKSQWQYCKITSAKHLLGRGVVSRTPVKNGPADADWNCQSWVADALTRMVNNGYLNVSQRAPAIDQMTDVCLEAGDE